MKKKGRALKSVVSTDKVKWLIVGLLFANLGALYIFTSNASVALPADINDDGVVNITDLSILLSNWGKTTPVNPNPPGPTPTPPGPNPQPGQQTLGVGGVATPADAIKTTADSTSELKITTSGTADKPRVYDGQGHTVGTITIRANYVTVQNFRIKGSSQDGVNTEGTGNTIQNNEILSIVKAGDGDLNAIEWFGNETKILYNKAENFIPSNAGTSHTDAMQTWVSSSHPTASKNVLIKGNRFVGPKGSDPGSDYSVPTIHQCVMAEGLNKGGNSGGNGDPSNWLIDSNYFGDSWNQCIKLDGVDNVAITRNEFAGNSTKIMEITSGSSNVKYYSDNKVTGSYGGVGYTVTQGAGPTTIPQ